MNKTIVMATTEASDGMGAAPALGEPGGRRYVHSRN